MNDIVTAFHECMINVESVLLIYVISACATLQTLVHTVQLSFGKFHVDNICYVFINDTCCLFHLQNFKHNSCILLESSSLTSFVKDAKQYISKMHELVSKHHAE